MSRSSLRARLAAELALHQLWPSGTVVLYPIDAPPIDGAPGPIDAITTTLGYNPPVILEAPDLKRKTGRTWSGPCERSMPLLLSRRVVFSPLLATRSPPLVYFLFLFVWLCVVCGFASVVVT